MRDVAVVPDPSSGQPVAPEANFADFSARREAEDSGSPIPEKAPAKEKAAPSAPAEKPGESEPVPEPGPQQGNKPRAERRSAKVEAEIRAEVRELNEIRAEVERLKAEKQALGVKPPAEAPPAEKPKTQETNGRPKKPALADFGGAEATDADYLKYLDAKDQYNEDLAVWTAREQIKSRETERQRETGEVERRNKLAERHEAVKAEFADYDAVLEAGNVELNNASVSFIEGRENGLRVLYKLCQNPSEAERIFGLDPFETVLELGKIEASLNGKKQDSPVRPATRALKPGADLPGRNGAPVDRMEAAIKGRDTASYIRLREAEDAAR